MAMVLTSGFGGKNHYFKIPDQRARLARCHKLARPNCLDDVREGNSTLIS
jgi:hypothetical protein